jgi:uncharacterized Zn finger protein
VKRDFDFTDGFPPSKPRDVKGGIRARSRRGAFGQSWWARRWIAVLEGFELGGRLQRARSYARRGQVVSIAVEKGRVDAVVQGSRPDPYTVTLETRTLPAGEWTRLAATLTREARFAAKLLAGEMPPDVEEAFRAAGLSLFPARREDLRTACSCPDWSNPCKHIAAVYYLLGEEFDRDPFLIFRLRGLDTTAMLATIGPADLEPETQPDVHHEIHAWKLARGEAAPESFWEGSRPEVDLTASVVSKETAAPLLRRLGNLPFWRGQEPLFDTLEPTYVAAANTALQILAGVDADSRSASVD